MTTPSPDEYAKRWERQWAAGLKPGEAFDRRGASPALTHALANGTIIGMDKRVFIPGCGRGYDLVEFVRSGAAGVVGLELIAQAQEAAEQYLTKQLNAEEKAKAQVFAGDFLKWQHPSIASWDVGYDYTFFSALLPSQRQEWAEGWARYLNQPGAQLVCLAFPLNHKSETGPPWPVTIEQYKDVLLPRGFVCVHEQPLPPELSHLDRVGREALLVFRRQ